MKNKNTWEIKVNPGKFPVNPGIFVSPIFNKKFLILFI
jgi:hypothetical protein